MATAAERRERYRTDSAYRERTRENARLYRKRNAERVRESDRARAQGALVNRLKAEVGACQRCGYDECLAALDWHHRDPAQKTTRDLKRRPDNVVRAELAGCVVLCANCHRAVHAGAWDITELEQACHPE